MQKYQIAIIVITIIFGLLFYGYVLFMRYIDSKINYDSKQIKYNRITLDTGFSYISVTYYWYQKYKKNAIKRIFYVGAKISDSLTITEVMSDSKVDKPLNFYQKLFLNEIRFKYSNNYDQKSVVNKFENIHNSAINGSFNQVFSNVNAPINYEMYNSVKLAIKNQEEIIPNDEVYLNFVMDKLRNNEVLDAKSAKSAIETFNKYQPLASFALNVISILQNMIS